MEHIIKNTNTIKNCFAKIFASLLFLLAIMLQLLHAQCPSYSTDEPVQILTCTETTKIDIAGKLALCTAPVITATADNGTVTVAGTSLVYAYTSGFIGFDVVQYQITCSNGDVICGKIPVVVAKCPDNIENIDCWINPSKTIWDIERKKYSNAAVHYLATPFVGDLDGDGRVEVVAPNHETTASSNAILIFNDKLELIRTISTPSAPQGSTTNLLIADVDNCGKGELIIATTTNLLYCYSHLGVEKWRTTVAMARVGDPSLIVADINGDGYPEILGVDKIYDGATGRHLVTLPAGGRGISAGGPASHMSVFADVDNDGILEVVSGKTVYKVTITNRSGTAGNSAVILAQMPAPFFDGFTSVADIDGDGKLDVIVTGGTGGGTASVYVWDGATPTQIGNTLQFSSSGDRISRAFVGDITGNGYPDIAFTYTNQIVAYEYNKASNVFVQLWKKTTSDASGATTMSMFDFNQDGETELIYRDMTHLRIINKHGDNIAAFACASATHTEYPVVVDLDGDGHADILVSGGLTNTNTDVRIMHFGSITPGQWASARPVWNQHAYNVTHINNDLSVPRYTPNPATVFPGEDGILGTADDVRPFNNFLQQQTSLNQNGNPFWLAANIAWEEDAEVVVKDNTAVITGCIKNTGNAALIAPFYITYYKNSAIPENIIALDSIKTTLMAGDKTCFTFTINNLCTIAPLESIWIGVNDKNGVFPFQAQCSVGERREVPVEVAECLSKDMYHQILTCLPSSNIPVVEKSACATSSIVITGNTAAGATVSANNTEIIYTRNSFIGRDTVSFTHTCNGQITLYTLHISVANCPDNIIEADCYGDPEAFLFTMKEHRRMTAGSHIKSTPLVGDLDGDGVPEIVTFSSDASYNNFVNLRVYDGATGALKAKMNLPSIVSHGSWITPTPAVLVDADRNGKGEIIFANNGRIYSYEAAGSGSTFSLVSKWPGGIAYTMPAGVTGGSLPQPIVTDFNGDGVPELVIYNQIYNAVTGALMGTTESITSAYMGRNPSHTGSGTGCTFAAAVDMDGDGLPELVAGGAVYKVNISPNGATATCTILSKNTAVGDGFTGVVDTDLDGRLEVVVANTNGANSFVKVWRPDIAGGGAGTFKSYTVTNSAGGATTYHSFPFIGDIDGAIHPSTGLKYPEICIMTPNAVTALKYNPLTDTHSQFWKITTSDASGGTGITLFDFNNDGAYELVYRDETNLRIIDGATGKNKVTFPCGSGTAWEYPVIADVDGSGSSSICVSCYSQTLPTTYDLVVFNSNSQPWAPARKVWNQMPYNILNINENLTVPKHSVSPATVFPGKDGSLGTVDDVRPFNGVLMQQTMLNQFGDPFWLMPNIVWEEDAEVVVTDNTAVITGCIKNTGNAALRAPIYVTFYKNSASIENIIALDSINTTLMVGDKTCFTFTINNLCSMAPLETIWIGVNDKNGVFPFQAQCSMGERKSVDIAPMETDYIAVITEPTCNEEGYTTYTRACDGDSYKTDYVPALTASTVSFINEGVPYGLPVTGCTVPLPNEPVANCISEWEFAGWSTEPDNTDDSHIVAFAGETEYAPESNITLYAVYRKPIDLSDAESRIRDADMARELTDEDRERDVADEIADEDDVENGRLSSGFRINRAADDWIYSSLPECPCEVNFELVHFTAKNNKDAIQITWATKSQYNSENFILYRSFDGENFEKLTTITGGGCGRAESLFLDYEFYDDDYNVLIYNESKLGFQEEKAMHVYYQLVHSYIDKECSNLLGHADAATSLLPVELIRFEAEAITNNTTHITWETATETNNDYFSLQRSFNGVDFKEIAIIAGAGTSSFAHQYEFFDHTAGNSPIVYYRLVQVDYNGATTTSNIIHVYIEANGQDFEITKLHNNDGLVSMELQFSSKQQHTITIYSHTTAIVHTQTVTDTLSKTIHIPNLAKGVYVVECVSNNRKQIKKIQI